MQDMKCEWLFGRVSPLFAADMWLPSGLHGYTHEFVSQLNPQQERDVLQKSIDVITSFTGKKPRGWTAPAWTPSPSSVKLLEEFGLEYDHSFMHHDSQLYYLPYPPDSWKETDYKTLSAHDWMSPMSTLKPSSIVEVPANWHVDDWPAFQWLRGQASGFVDPHQIERFWQEQFEFCYREYDHFVFPISIHPQVSGKPQVLMMHERLIEWINQHDGVEWCTFEDMANKFRKGEIQGVQVREASTSDPGMARSLPPKDSLHGLLWKQCMRIRHEKAFFRSSGLEA
jgi:peptidoglycan/xylan/chitin deacetylase (PgdA/CDA1 family)